MNTKILKVGITGGIGSGKSLFCSYLEEKKYRVINADYLAKDLIQKDEKIKSLIIKEFGDKAFKNGKLDKKFLAEHVFSDPLKVQIINSIVHPAVIKNIESIFNSLAAIEKIVFVEAALIYEAEMESMFDYIALINADEEIRVKRKTKGSKMTSEEFEKRNSNQIPDEEKSKRADFVFKNNGTLAELKKQSELFLTVLNGLL